MVIHAFASQPNYWRHLAPIVDALRGRGHRVETWAGRATQPWGANVRARRPEGLIIVASWNDAQRWQDRRLVYVEHGAGQTYRDGASAGYSGADGLSHVRLFLAPGDHVADRWRARYPQAVVAAVGCPALDQHLQGDDQQDDDDEDDDGPDADVHAARLPPPPGAVDQHGCDQRPGDEVVHHGDRIDRRPTVVVTSHWRCGVVAETMPIVERYEAALRQLADYPGIRLLGHVHPRALRRAQAFWGRVGVELEVDPDVVLAGADLLVADNTSLMYEAAALDVPVLALNGPSYRRDVEHGLRFWSHVPGIQCDTPAGFMPAIMSALDDPPAARLLRRRAACHVYAHRDGRSAERAADAIERVA